MEIHVGIKSTRPEKLDLFTESSNMPGKCGALSASVNLPVSVETFSFVAPWNIGGWIELTVIFLYYMATIVVLDPKPILSYE